MMLQEMERSFHDAVCVEQRVMESKSLVVGGGAVETALYLRLQDYAMSLSTSEQLAVQAFGKALLIIPKTLAVNAAKEAAVEAKDAFTADNKCYTIESSGKSVVTNPKGTLYMTANSASGSKYYELINSQQDYIEVRSQNWLPSYSVIDLTKDDFKITTYQITDEGKVENIDNTFTIHNTVSR